jgi:uncharacterized protein
LESRGPLVARWPLHLIPIARTQTCVKRREMADKTTLSIPAQILLGAQRVYKLTLSPLIGQQCRFLPTCSNYAADCVRAHGAWAGSWMALARVCRCRPGGGSGYDPVPAACEAVSPLTPWKMGDWHGPAQVAAPEGEITPP